MKLIKKYKNRRLYDTDTSQYITIETVQQYVMEGVPFRVVDSSSGADLTNATLLQILVETEAGATHLLSSEVLRQLITLAHHPMSQSFKQMLEPMLTAVSGQQVAREYDEVREAWDEHMKKAMAQWQQLFKPGV